MQLYGRHGADKLKGLSLMTYGSQLRWVFPKVFPSYVGYWEQAVVRSQALHYRWRNMYRETDPLGDRVLEGRRPARQPGVRPALHRPAVAPLGHHRGHRCPTDARRLLQQRGLRHGGRRAGAAHGRPGRPTARR